MIDLVLGSLNHVLTLEALRRDSVTLTVVQQALGEVMSDFEKRKVEKRLNPKVRDVAEFAFHLAKISRVAYMLASGFSLQESTR